MRKCMSPLEKSLFQRIMAAIVRMYTPKFRIEVYLKAVFMRITTTITIRVNHEAL